MTSKNDNRIQLKVNYDGQPKEKPALAAFVFDKAGNFLESSKIDETGNFNIAANKSRLNALQIFIAPAGNVRTGASIADLEKVNAYQPYLRVQPGADNIISLHPIPELNYQWWWQCKCRVRGRVTKKVFNGGAWQNMPVCNARVHICEVDKWQLLLPKLPDDIIFRIRDEIVRTKWPIPPIPDPGPLRRSIQPPIFRQPASLTATRTSVNANVLGADEKASPVSFGLNSLKAQLSSGNSAYHIRQELSSNFKLIFPYLCYWPWLWRYFYTCEELAIDHTDGQGRFDATVKYNCFGDKPDIYIWIEYFLDGSWKTVYNPGRACHTYWDYACGSEINIAITDSRVPHCGRTDVIGEIAEILSIGTGAQTSHILQRNVMQTVQGQSFNAKGLTNIYFGGLTGIKYVNPFGDTLNFYADFGSTLHTSGVSHFKCSYKRSSGSTWTVLNNPIIRIYEDEIQNGANPPFQQRKGFDLKDSSYPDLYIIPHHDGAAQPGIPAPAGTLLHRDWMSEDFVIASIDSKALLNELYDFRFEFFRINSGSPERVSVPKSTFQVPNPDDINMSLPLSNTGFVSTDYPDFHAADYLLNDPGNSANALAFQMSFLVNNESCNAVIDNIIVKNIDGTTATSDTACGFAQYLDKNTSLVNFSFEASHPQNWAVFGFGVIRGNGNPCPDANTGGMVIGSSSNGYTLSGGKFTKDVAAASLLGSCVQAAFSENLHVYALATNGNRRLDENDAGDVAAYAIEPQD